jgi:hypothetical protein
MADRGFFYASYPMSIYGLYKACQGWHDGDPSVAVLCVYGAITSIWTTFLLADKTAVWTGSLVTRLISAHGFKRDLEVQGLLEDFSAELGVEVRHLGFWNDTTAPAIANLKRSLPMEGENRLAVFGARAHGYDFHFTHRGEINGKALLRFGFEVEDVHGEELSKRRDSPYFSKGGIDFLIEPVKPLEKGWWTDDDEQFGWLFEQIKCLLGETTLWDTRVEEATGVFFQLYDNMRGETIAAAAMAAFGEGGKSAIHEMDDVRGSIDVSRTCMEIGKFDIFG